MNKIQVFISTLCGICGGIIGFLYGEMTGTFYALLVCMILDYLTGIIVALVQKKLSSQVGFKGLAKKLLILIFTALAHVFDVQILGGNVAVMTAVMLFYIVNEAVSIIENSAKLGLPVPEKLKSVLAQIKDKSE